MGTEMFSSSNILLDVEIRPWGKGTPLHPQNIYPMMIFKPYNLFAMTLSNTQEQWGGMRDSRMPSMGFEQTGNMVKI